MDSFVLFRHLEGRLNSSVCIASNDPPFAARGAGWWSTVTTSLFHREKIRRPDLKVRHFLIRSRLSTRSTAIKPMTEAMLTKVACSPLLTIRQMSYQSGETVFPLPAQVQAYFIPSGHEV